MKVFICGITGNQGSALARLLLPSHAVVGLTRSPSSPTALSLTALGAVLHTGSYTSPSTLHTALADCTALFLNLAPNLADPSAERRDGLAVLAAARAVPTITHVVYSTALSVDRPEALPGYDPDAYIAKMLAEKRFLEGSLRDAGFARWTILRPGHFMSNYVGAPAQMREQELIRTGVCTTAFAPMTRLPLVDVATIAAFARATLQDPAKFHGKEVALADELLTMEEIVGRLGAKAGRPLRAAYMPEEEVEKRKATEPLVGAQYLMRGLERFVDVEEVKGWAVPMSSFDAFLEREAALVKETYGVESTAT